MEKSMKIAWYSKLESYLAANNDLIYIGNHESMSQEFKTMMMNEFAMTDLGNVRPIFGLTDPNWVQGQDQINLDQCQISLKLEERSESISGQPKRTHTSIKLLKTDQGVKVDSTLFKQLVGSFMYLTTKRPDIAHFVSLISRFMENPKDKHFLAAKRILRYLQGIQNLRIFYKAGGNEELLAYTDSDYAGDLDDRKSTSGYAFMLGGGVISWASKKLIVISLFTTEAEFKILEHLDYCQNGATVMFCDNASTIKLFKNPVLHGRNLCNNGVIQLNYYSTGE
ncbi:hypothetical protein CR513_34376, partial [Mucuna pruriens]